MRLYVDDMRSGRANDNIYPASEWSDWIICRSVENAKLLVQAFRFELISIDHDMGEDEDGKQLPTGYDFVCWLEKTKHESGFDYWPVDRMVVHSANPVGAARMQIVIDRHYNK